MASHWYFVPKKISSPRLRLICFPYAGGGIRTYQPWANQLPDGVELVAVQPPGRGSFIGTKAYNSMAELVAALQDELQPLLDRPYVLFGHSLGSRVAFELLHQIQIKQQRLPELFLASGSCSPDTVRVKAPTYHLSDDKFIAELQRMNGTPSEVLENKEFMSFLLPLLRADFQIAETYRYTGITNFPLEVHVLGGEDDVDVPVENLPLWGNFFNNNVKVHTFVGDHFFIESQQDAVVRLVKQLLQTHLLGVVNEQSSYFSSDVLLDCK
tara:strand:+ start:1827 stop:2630 length:804 start_codon:yes stop_codon:yes gene_type:complete